MPRPLSGLVRQAAAGCLRRKVKTDRPPSAACLAWVDLHAGRHGIGDVLFGDHPDNLVGPRHTTAADNEGHDRTLPPDPLDYFEGYIIFTHDREIGPRDIAQSDTGVDPIQAPTQPGIDTNHTENPIVAGNDDVL